MSGQNQSNERDIVIQELSDKIDDLRKNMPNGELTSLLNDIKVVMRQQNQMGADIRDVKQVIMDPEDGLIVRVNKNTEYRKSLEDQEGDNSKILEEHQSLVKFKDNVTKLLWLIITVVTGILGKIIFFTK